MFRAAIVEDSREDAEVLLSMLQQFYQETGTQILGDVFDNPLNFLDDYGHRYDLVFMDIELPMMTGMVAAGKLREKDEEIPLIFVTNMAKYALHGYDVDALDFVLKPLNYYSFAMKLRKAVRYMQRFSTGLLTLKTEDGLVRIHAAEVIYAEVLEHMVTYHSADRSWTVRTTMKKVEEELMPLGFARCNNAYLVNLKHVRGLKDNNVLAGEAILPISRSKRRDFIKSLSAYLGGSI